MEKYFFGGVTPEGFSTELTKVAGSKEYYTYILKGGPGTGKSRMMKKIAGRFEKDEKVTCFYCSSNPDSLDAVLMHESKVIVVDGTPPHVFEPQLPGICQEIVDLGQFWDKAILEENRERIIEASELNRSLMAGAASYCKALGMICDDTYSCGERSADRKMIAEAASCLCDSLLKNHERKKSRGEQIKRQLSVMTKRGYTTLPDAAETCSKLYILDDELFAASCLFIEIVAAHVMECGYDTTLSPCLLSARPFSEHLLIDELDAVVMTSNPLTKITNEKAEHIDCSSYYEKDRLRTFGERFATNRSLTDRLSDVTREMFEEADRVHDEMERYYNSAMDFDALGRVCERICDEIEHRGGELRGRIY